MSHDQLHIHFLRLKVIHKYIDSYTAILYFRATTTTRATIPSKVVVQKQRKREKVIITREKCQRTCNRLPIALRRLTGIAGEVDW